MSLRLCWLMTPGLSEDIWCHLWPCLFYANGQIEHQMTSKEGGQLMTALDHFWCSSGAYVG